MSGSLLYRWNDGGEPEVCGRGIQEVACTVWAETQERGASGEECRMAAEGDRHLLDAPACGAGYRMRHTVYLSALFFLFAFFRHYG